MVTVELLLYSELMLEEVNLHDGNEDVPSQVDVLSVRVAEVENKTTEQMGNHSNDINKAMTKESDVASLNEQTPNLHHQLKTSFDTDAVTPKDREQYPLKQQVGHTRWLLSHV